MVLTLFSMLFTAVLFENSTIIRADESEISIENKVEESKVFNDAGQNKEEIEMETKAIPLFLIPLSAFLFNACVSLCNYLNSYVASVGRTGGAPVAREASKIAWDKYSNYSNFRLYRPLLPVKDYVFTTCYANGTC